MQIAIVRRIIQHACSLALAAGANLASRAARRKCEEQVICVHARGLLASQSVESHLAVSLRVERVGSSVVRLRQQQERLEDVQILVVHELTSSQPP